MNMWNVGVIGFFCAHPDDGMSHLGDAPMNAFNTVHVALSGCSAESRHGHNCGADVESAELNNPLEGSDEGLVNLDVFKI